MTSPLHRSGSAAGELHQPGELTAGMALGIIPAMQEGHLLFTEALLVFGAVEIGIDLGVVALLLQDREVVQHLVAALGRTAEQMLEVQLDEVIGVGVLKELGAVEAALGHGAHKFTHAQVAIAEQRFSTTEALTVHHVLIPQHLTVNSTNQSRFVVGAGTSGPVFVVAIVGEPFDA